MSTFAFNVGWQEVRLCYRNMEAKDASPKPKDGAEGPRINPDRLDPKNLEAEIRRVMAEADGPLRGHKDALTKVDAVLKDARVQSVLAKMGPALMKLKPLLENEENLFTMMEALPKMMRIKDPKEKNELMKQLALSKEGQTVPPFNDEQSQLMRSFIKVAREALPEEFEAEFGTDAALIDRKDGKAAPLEAKLKQAKAQVESEETIDGQSPQAYYDAQLLKLKNANPDKVANINDKSILDGKMMGLGYTVSADGKIEPFKATDEKSAKFEKGMHLVMGKLTMLGGHIGKLQEKYPGMFGAKKPAEAAKTKPVETDADKLRVTIADKGLKTLREEAGKKKTDAEKAVTELTPKLGDLEKAVAEKRTAVAAIKEPAEKAKGETELQKMQTETEAMRGQLAAKQAEVKQAEAQLKQYEEAEKAAQKEKGELQSRFDELVVNAKAKGKDAFVTVLSTAQVAFDADKLTVNLSLKAEGGEKALVALKKFLMEQKLDANAVDPKSVIRKPKEFLDSLEKTLSQTV